MGLVAIQHAGQAHPDVHGGIRIGRRSLGVPCENAISGAVGLGILGGDNPLENGLGPHAVIVIARHQEGVDVGHRGADGMDFLVGRIVARRAHQAGITVEIGLEISPAQIVEPKMLFGILGNRRIPCRAGTRKGGSGKEAPVEQSAGVCQHKRQVSWISQATTAPRSLGQ